ncbi:MAG: Xaa-Pro peptidase family protein [Betaproteobacteria bacterium]
MDRAELAHVPSEMAFPESEYAARLARTRVAMARADVDVLVVHSLPDICYLTGFQTPLSDWYSCAIVPMEGEPVLQVCDHELAAMNTYVRTLLPVLWESMDAAVLELGAYLRHVGAATARIGLVCRRPGLTPYTREHLRQELPGATFTDVSDLVPRIRAIKSPAEIACMRNAAQLSGLGMTAAIAAVRDGATENDVTAAAMQAIVAAGGEYFSIDPIVRAGRRSGVTHATAKRGVIRPGDAVFMEIGGVYQRYCAPLLRTAVIGPPPEALRRLGDVSLRAMEMLLANLVPGRSMGDVASAAMQALAGLDAAVRMRGYFGYSVGIGFPPSWVERSVEIAEGRTDVLVPGMIFHLHRALRIPGVVGVAFSETATITESGHELLTAFPRELLVL